MSSENKLAFCNSCDDNYAEDCIYTCSTCESENENNSSCLGNERFASFTFCENCIFVHCKKGHDIKDVDGLVVLTCKEHFQVLDQYCRSCDVLFCVRCLKTHRNHKQEPINERVKEIKSEIFKQLTKFEDIEKPANAKQGSISKIVDRNESDVKEILKNMEQVFDAVKGKVETGLSKFKETEKRAKGAVETVIQIQGQLRCLLSLTSQQLLIDWKDVNEKIGSFKKEEQFVKEFSLNDKRFTIGKKSKQELEKTVEDIADDLELVIPSLESDATERKCLDEVKLPLIVSEKDKVKNIFSHTQNGAMLVLIETEESLQLYRYVLDTTLLTVKRRNMSSIDWQKSLSIQLMFPPFKYGSQLSEWLCCLLMTDGSIVKADFGKISWSKYESAPAAGENLISCTERDSEGNIHWYYWDSGYIRSTNRASCGIPCKSKANCLHADQTYQIVLDPDSMEISVYCYGSSRGTIPHTVHGCDAIDKFAAVSDFFLLWSTTSKAVTIVRHYYTKMKSFTTDIFQKITWTNEMQTATANVLEFAWYRQTIFLLPAIELNPNPHSSIVKKDSHFMWAFLHHSTR